MSSYDVGLGSLLQPTRPPLLDAGTALLSQGVALQATRQDDAAAAASLKNELRVFVMATRGPLTPPRVGFTVTCMGDKISEAVANQVCRGQSGSPTITGF